MSKSRPEMTRKQFLAAAAGLVGVAVAMACDEDSNDTSSGEDGPEECSANGEGDLAAEIQTNHGHTLTIPFADVEAGETKTYMLAGPHEHTVEVDALVFEKLLDTGSATVSSSSADGHKHFVDLSC